MARPPLRFLVRQAATLVIMASVVGVVGVAHAASLGGISSSLEAWSYPAEIVTADTTPPTITGSVAPAPNAAGWNNTAVTITFTCVDEYSGVASCTSPVTVSGEGAGQVVIGDAADDAGNTASTSVTVDIDLTGPVVQIVGVSDGGVLTAAPNVTCSATDALSGVAGACVVTITSGGGGQFTAKATASDRAGNPTVKTVGYRILALCGVGPPNVPCVVPYGTVFDADLVWNADVLVLGEVTKKIEVLDGTVTVGSTGVVGDDIKQTGTGGVTVVTGGVVDGKIEEKGDGSVIVDDSAARQRPRRRRRRSHDRTRRVRRRLRQGVRAGISRRCRDRREGRRGGRRRRSHDHRERHHRGRSRQGDRRRVRVRRR